MVAHFDSFASEYDHFYQTKLGSFVDTIEKELIEKLAEMSMGMKVLDIGSGTGTYSIWMAKKGLDVTAIDQSEEMTRVARKKGEKEGTSINWNIGDAQFLPFEDESFDLVVSITAIEFTDNPKAVLEEAIRVLKSNGKLVIGVLTKNSPWGELYQDMGKDPSHLFAKAHLFEEKEIVELLPYPYDLLKGLYLPPTEDFELEQAWKDERDKQRQQADRAGFFVIRWIKE